MTAEAVGDALAGHAGPWTEQDYLALPESLSRIELLDGALLVSPAPAGQHQRVVRRISFALEDAAPDGVEVLDAINVRVGPGRILIPDVVVLRTAGLDKTVYESADVLMVVEVASPLRPGIDRSPSPPRTAGPASRTTSWSSPTAGSCRRPPTPSRRLASTARPRARIRAALWSSASRSRSGSTSGACADELAIGGETG